jgi:hypothetical protein
MMRELLSLSTVTRLLESPPKRSGIEKVGEGGFLLRAAPKAKMNGGESPTSVASSIATRGIESGTGEFPLLGTGVDFQDAFLLALCERAGAEMMVEEILRRSRRFLGSSATPVDVRFTLANMTDRVTKVREDCYRVDPSACPL